ncbi:transcriptional regulator, TetR family [Jatrophihabitans endophyticus]|uniref:Transcriptional regulator, TetR family n=1 Tax=Jatrophihabitans endophyticus TaxID=1206085 RepID=A0A1M5RPA5_9ACTN|nr:TetR/AcrR family transcriptional regulator [Jatrophihabitans endophyticus]SHH28036.1 transcriptional regulator, TetR family [Jatrophihabitans endophyticus]
MTSRRTPSGDVRRALVDAAVTVLERDGVAGLTVRAVAGEAKVAPMGVYNHLDGKAGLLLAVLQRGFDALRDAVTPPRSVPATQALLESGRGYRRFALAGPTTYALMFSTARPESLDLDALLPHAAPAFQALVDVVVESQRVGVVRPGDPGGLALQIWSAVHGGIGLELTGNVGDAMQADRAYEQLLAMIQRGVAPDAG